MVSQRWTEEEIATISANAHLNTVELGELLPGRTQKGIGRKLEELRKKNLVQRQKDAKAAILNAELNPPIKRDREAYIRELESELATLREQRKWSHHADSASQTGGVLTLRASDHHYGDANHLLACGRSLWHKSLVITKLWQPDHLQFVMGDDWIAGRGIYREQDLDSVTSNANDQCAVGAMHAREWLLKFREEGITAPITWHVMRGNHDYANGHSLTEYLFLLLQSVTKDIPDVKFILHHDKIVLNLADTGTYNVLIRHGTGYSKTSPNSPLFIDAVKDEIIAMQMKMQPHERIRRVLSGHTHWLSGGLERLVGLHFDTTGGLQRNTRIRLGANQRPCGWIAYPSPKGLDSDILQPILLQPDPEIYDQEIGNPHLARENQQDAGERLKAFRELMESSGDYAKSEFGVLNEGRW